MSKRKLCDQAEEPACKRAATAPDPMVLLPNELILEILIEAGPCAKLPRLALVGTSWRELFTAPWIWRALLAHWFSPDRAREAKHPAKLWVEWCNQYAGARPSFPSPNFDWAYGVKNDYPSMVRMHLPAPTTQMREAAVTLAIACNSPEVTYEIARDLGIAQLNHALVTSVLNRKEKAFDALLRAGADPYLKTNYYAKGTLLNLVVGRRHRRPSGSMMSEYVSYHMAKSLLRHAPDLINRHPQRLFLDAFHWHERDYMLKMLVLNHGLAGDLCMLHLHNGTKAKVEMATTKAGVWFHASIFHHIGEQHKDLVQALLLGGDPDFRAPVVQRPQQGRWPWISGHTALAIHCVIRPGVTKQLLLAGADPNIQSLEGFAPLHVVCQRGLYENERYDLERHDRLYQKSRRHHERLVALLKAGADPNLRTTRYQHTPLHLLYLGSKEMIQRMEPNPLDEWLPSVLIKRGADPYAVDINGNNFLHMLVDHGNYQNLRGCLSDRIVDLARLAGTRNNDGHTPVCLAHHLRNTYMTEVLENMREGNMCDRPELGSTEVAAIPFELVNDQIPAFTGACTDPPEVSDFKWMGNKMYAGCTQYPTVTWRDYQIKPVEVELEYEDPEDDTRAYYDE